MDRRSRRIAAETTPDGGPMKPYAIDGVQRPTKRSECVDGPRPCPWVSCRHHLLLEISHGKPRTNADGTKRDARPTTIRLNRDEGDGRLGRRAGLLAQCGAEVARAFIRDAVEHLEHMPETCALDVADKHPDGIEISGVAMLLGVTAEAIASGETIPEEVREGLRDYEDHVPADHESNLARIGARRGIVSSL